MKYEQLQHIFIEVNDGRGQHGSFLTAFAKAFINADDSNAYLLNDVATTLVKKYSLDDYLDNFEINQ